MTRTDEAGVATTANTNLAGKYLTFALSTEKYALQILKVHEIIGLAHITPVPQSPEYLKGVINLRGKIIPVVDLRIRLGVPEKAYDEKTCIIVVDAQINEKMMSIGVIVDTVLEVTTFSQSNIEPAPDYGVSADTSCVLGMGRTEESVVILLDIERALNVQLPASLLEH